MNAPNRAVTYSEPNGLDILADNERLYIRQAPGKGWGVFARRDFAAGEVIEKSPVLILPDPQWQLLESTALKNYYLHWPNDCTAIALGFGSFYNHSETNNARTIRNSRDNILEVVAIRNIRAEEEITIRYSCSPWFTILP